MPCSAKSLMSLWMVSGVMAALVCLPTLGNASSPQIKQLHPRAHSEKQPDKTHSSAVPSCWHWKTMQSSKLANMRYKPLKPQGNNCR